MNDRTAHSRKEVTHQEGTFQGQGGLNLYYQCWLPDGDLRATLVIAHGLAEHGGRYSNLVDYFVPRGYAIYVVDHRGHGKSEGWRCHVERFEHYLDDLDTFITMVRQAHPDGRLFLAGHSMGGTIGVAYALEHPRTLDGLIVSGVTLRPGSSVSPVLVIMARLLSALVPRMGLTVIDASTISKDLDVVRAYENDPLVYRGKVSARLGAEFLKVTQRLAKRLTDIRLPILVMHGAEDRLSDPQSSRLLYGLASSEDRTLLLYEGCYHEIFNEPERGRVLADMEAWLEAHT